MINKNRTIELLAPARDKECAFAAINSGADAVYIGPDAFGARKKASNSIDDIKEIVEYAHKFLVKVYVTVNTILYENEVEKAQKLIWDLYDAGVDAVIFQDFSFFEMDLPPIALHASTQCNNDSLEKIKFLKNLNVQRVVLPREFSFSEIKQVTENVDIETEVFVHGALCVSYSGQCYFSNFIGGRSANRGECAQPCRKRYSLVDEKDNILLKNQYLLSMKDNNLSGYLNSLVKAGVTSLKIEGRLKDSSYVKNVVSYYRKELDKISDSLMASKGVFVTDFCPDTEKTFNRGYTDFFFDEQRKTFINPYTPKFQGEKLGRVLAVKGKKITLQTKKTINISDKVTYFENGELTGTTVTNADGHVLELLNVGSVKVGTILYRNFDSMFYKSLKSAQFERKLPLKIVIGNTKIQFLSFGDNCFTYYFDDVYETAKNKDNAKLNIVKQLSKLGDTEYFAESVNVADDFQLFIPVSKLNEIRRVSVENLQKISTKNYVFQRRNTIYQKTKYPFENLDYSYNISNSKAKDFYENCGCKVVELSPECIHSEGKLVLMKTKHCLRDFAGICLKKTKDNKKLYLVDEVGTKYPLKFECSKCIMKIEEP